MKKKKRKCKEVTDSLEKHADHLYPQLQRIWIPLIQESVLSLNEIIQHHPKG